MSRNQSRVKLGIIGCGIAARELHWPALEKLKNKFEIVAVCNHTSPKARRFARMVGDVPYTLDYRELLRRNDVEAVDIVLPIDLNFRVTAEALAMGKHVLVEKPVTADLKEGRKLIRATSASKQVVMVAENFRYRAVYRRAAALLNRGAIGRPYASSWDIYHRIVQKDNPYARTGWRIHHKYPGGFLTDAGVHNIAAIRFLLGEITDVTGLVQSVNPSIGKMDTMMMQYATDRDVSGALHLFFAARGYNENRFLIFGTGGSMRIGDDDVITIEKPGRARHVEVVKDDGGYKAEFLDFHRAIRKGKVPFSTVEEGFRDLQVLLSVIGPSRKEGSSSRR